MKIFKFLGIGMLSLLMSCAVSKIAGDLEDTLKVFNNSNSKMILVAAHRGAHLDNFENSLASTKNAIEIGVDIIEVDLRTTKDGHLVLMHDSKIDRTTTGKGRVEDMTLAEIHKYRLKSPSGKISEEPVPTFEEFLKITKGKIMVDVDMKTDNVEGILTTVEENVPDREVFYFDNDYDQLDSIKALKKSAQLMPRAYSYQMADSAIARFKPIVVHIDDDFYTKEVVELINKNKAKVWINTLGTYDEQMGKGHMEIVYEEILKKGANIIQTDEPEILLKFLRSKNLHP